MQNKFFSVMNEYVLISNTSFRAYWSLLFLTSNIMAINLWENNKKVIIMI